MPRKSKKHVSLIAVVILTLSLLVLPQAALADFYTPGVIDIPTGVVGRTLTPAQSGDAVDWIEIAQNGRYSLIVRTKFINIYPHAVMYGKDVRGDLDWQVTNGFGHTLYLNSDYLTSNVRGYINDWFNGTSQREAEKLPANARLRAFTMQASPFPLGTSTTHLAVVNGYSKPSKYQVGIGDDIAFALSYGECASFLSETMYLRDNYVMVGGQKVYVAEPESSAVARANYARMDLPTRPIYGMWCRSPGDQKDTVAFLQGRYTYNPGTKNEVTTAGRVFQGPINTINSSMKGLCYPAVWVDQDIFTDSPKMPPAPITVDPTAVDGRILTPDMTGDNSDWIEIAQNSGFSLIVRKNFINIYPHKVMYGKVVAGDLDWQHTNGFGKTPHVHTIYLLSNVRDYINDWFNCTAMWEAEKLPPDARLRRYSVQNTMRDNIGTGSTLKSVVDGYSKPAHYQAGVGVDVAFALSFGESASFLSETQFLRDNYVMVGNQRIYSPEPSSSTIARSNYAKMNLPTRAIYGMWLRSPGDIKETITFLQGRYTYNPGTKNEVTTEGRVFQGPISTINSSMKGLVYPAMWVGEGIFGPDTYTLTYDANGGDDPPAPQSAPRDTFTTVSVLIPNRTDYVFDGWATTPTATIAQYQPGDNIFMDGDITLYAVWAPAQRGFSVIGRVFPLLVAPPAGFGESFLRMHDIVVELRETFKTPAPPELSTKPVLVDNVGTGEFTFHNVPEGEYVLYIKRPGYLVRTMIVTINAASVDPILGMVVLAPPGAADNGVYKLWPGDCNDDLRIENLDLQMIQELLDLADQLGVVINASHPDYNPACDLDADGIISAMDMQVVLNIDYWDKSAVDYAGAAGVDFWT